MQAMHAAQPQNASRRVSTCVDGLDDLIGGGFPDNAAILLVGRPGAGKTTFCAQYIHHGALMGEKGIFCTAGQDAEQFRRDFSSIGFDFPALEKKGMVKILELPPHEKDFDEALAQLTATMGEFRPSRLAIDSFSFWFSSVKSDEKRKELYSTLKHLVKHGTILLTLEKGEDNVAYPEEFATDAVLQFDLSEDGDGYRQRMKILKMRRTLHPREFFDYRLTDAGIRVLPRPALEHPRAVSLERTGSGVGGLDEALGGGIFKGTSSLLCGHTGAGKTIMSMQFLMEGIRRGEKCLYLSMDESTGQLMREAESLGWDFMGLVKKGKMGICALYPENLAPDEFLLYLIGRIQANGSERVVFDSVSRLEKAFSGSAARNVIKRLNAYCKCNMVTLLMTYETEQPVDHVPVGDVHISSLVDSIIMLKQVELLGEIKRSLTILKHRGSSHDHTIKEFEIGQGGVRIRGDLRRLESLMPGVMGGFP